MNLPWCVQMWPIIKEERYITVGMDYLGQLVTVVFTYRGEDICLISARKATSKERLDYENRRE